VYYRKKIWSLSIFLIIVFLFTACSKFIPQKKEGEDIKNPIDISEELKEDQKENKEQKKDLTREEAIAIENEFFYRVLNLDTMPGTNEVVDFNSKEELLNYVMEVAGKDLATLFVDNIYEEQAGKLYLIPKGAPPRFLVGSPYEFNKIDEDSYVIIQDEENEMYGPYRLTIEFKYIDGKWKMTDRIFEERIIEGNNEEIIDSKTAKTIISDIANKLIYALSVKDADSIAKYVHPKKGVRFTPYTNVSLEDDLVFSKEEMKTFFENNNIYKWGYYDGSGEEINLTPSEYYDIFVYSKDFINAPEIGYNEVLSMGNMLENQFDVYDNPIIVEYYFSGFNPEYEGLDWQSLRLVFEQYEGNWNLVGIIHNQWTI